jgi:ectoine hydroxylase-related dioxygenase (phytanoyl-CoA dioxygenase family)
MSVASFSSFAAPLSGANPRRHEMISARRQTETCTAPAIPEHLAGRLDFDALRHDYSTAGCAIVRGAIDTRLTGELEQRFRGLFCGVLDKEGVTHSTSDDLDALHLKAAEAIGPERAKHFVTMGRDMPAFSALLSAPGLLRILHGLFQTQELQSIADSNVMRVDRPGSTITDLEWHQDYPYNMLAMNAATAWMPILPVTRGMGRPRLVPRAGPLLTIAYDEDAKAQFHNSRYIGIDNLDAMHQHFESEALIAPDMQPGDLLLIHALCLHRSGANTSRRSRWVATARYGPFMDDALYARTWFTARAKYPDLFRAIHPDLFRLKQT